MKLTHANLIPRVTTADVRQYHVLGFGVDNLYPQTVELIVEGSGRATSCTNKLAEFIEGDGFTDNTVSETVINSDGETMDKLLRKAAEDMALYKGRAYLVKYNPFGDINEVFLLPYEWCRIGIGEHKEEIAVYDNWDRSILKQIKKNDITYYPVFNPEVALDQIAATTFEKYPGQVLYISGSNVNAYGLATVDAELESCVSDGQIKISHFSSLITGFMDTTLITFRDKLSPDERDKLEETMQEFQGADNAGKLLILDGLATDGYNVSNLTSEKVASAYDKVETSVRERIRELYNIPSVLVGKESATGFADQAQLIVEAKNHYSEITNRDRRAITEDMQKIFSNSILIMTDDFDITPIGGEAKPALVIDTNTKPV